MNQVIAFILLATAYTFSGNGYLSKELQPVRMNVARIDTISTWAKVTEAELHESAEGGGARFYYKDNRLQKIEVVNYGEAGQTAAIYYLLNKRLSFVLEETHTYNIPIYWGDSLFVVENSDTIFFDYKKTKVTRDSSFFDKNGTLIHQSNNEDCGSPFADEYLAKEQKRIEEEFYRLLKLPTKLIED